MLFQVIALSMLQIARCKEYLGGSIATIGPDTFGMMPQYHKLLADNSFNYHGGFKNSTYAAAKKDIRQMEVKMLSKYKEVNAILLSTSRFYYNYRHVGNLVDVASALYKLGLLPRQQLLSLAPETCLCHPTNTFPGRVYVEKSVDITDYKDEVSNDVTNNFLEHMYIPFRSSGLRLDSLRFLMTQRFPSKYPQSSRLATKYRVEVDGVHADLDLPTQFVYMTGHGGDRYFQFQAKDVLSANEIELYMTEFFIKHPNVHTLMISDTCQASTLFEGLSNQDPMVWVASSPRGVSSYSYNANSQLTVSPVGKFTYYVAGFLCSVAKGIKERKDRAAVSRFSFNQLKRHMERHCPEEMSVFHANASIMGATSADTGQFTPTINDTTSSKPDVRKIYLGEFLFNYRVSYFNTYSWPLMLYSMAGDVVALKGQMYEAFNLNTAEALSINRHRLYTKMGENGLFVRTVIESSGLSIVLALLLCVLAIILATLRDPVTVGNLFVWQ
ncbi:GPI-anchor transamidase [Babesia bigemina]|uniref:GPI-anchor transamidase n=1 Tax=Babesia bigemina TaxID=5866 RepID=A0A061D6Q1_BABBI|nr:GPI-anchor transamidase [Babesia bigemina]CDR96228.1 GPI-anchor transamidase [Babesia bigemina]|eukprot:XP_012768414.1 GPI-anchor transamidase [Babesia bigemina]